MSLRYLKLNDDSSKAVFTDTAPEAGERTIELPAELLKRYMQMWASTTRAKSSPRLVRADMPGKTSRERAAAYKKYLTQQPAIHDADVRQDRYDSGLALAEGWLQLEAMGNVMPERSNGVEYFLSEVMGERALPSRKVRMSSFSMPQATI